MAEALETWDVNLFSILLPDVYDMIRQVDARFRSELRAKRIPEDRIARMAPIGDGRIRMAWLAIYVSISVNGVAAIHTKILQEQTLHDWYEIWPERFSNKTNGVTPRRWLRVCNPELSDLLTRLSGDDGWVRDLGELSALSSFAGDKKVLKQFLAIKATKKQQLADFVYAREGVRIDPASLFDVHVKRIHEYKRQLLNALYILDLYFRLKKTPDAAFVPRTFLFAGKAAPGYFRAKATIKLINEISRIVDADPDVKGRIKVVFLGDYCVSAGAKVYPAADLSEQISTAGTEASGTGNMKFMMNGAVTLGTFDGANVEIVEAAGEENEFIFGARVEHFPGIRSVYDPRWQYQNVPGLQRAVDAMVDGTLDDGGTGMFHELHASLLYGVNWQPADVYYVLGDFEDYRKVRDLAAEAYRDPLGWARRCWLNICASGRFSSDRTLEDYASGIWKIKKKSISLFD
jgi:starch phosphorylase